jgi:hypothetical protein
MKQGSASRTVLEKKTEPKPYRVSEAYPAQLGAATFYKKETMYQGRGFKAPNDQNVATHKSGSQRRY